MKRKEVYIHNILVSSYVMFIPICILFLGYITPVKYIAIKLVLYSLGFMIYGYQYRELRNLETDKYGLYKWEKNGC